MDETAVEPVVAVVLGLDASWIPDGMTVAVELVSVGDLPAMQVSAPATDRDALQRAARETGPRYLACGDPDFVAASGLRRVAEATVDASLLDALATETDPAVRELLVSRLTASRR